MNDTTFQGDGKVAYVPVVVNTNLTKQTNADRIRAMTDGEMAKEIAWLIVEAMKQLHPFAKWKAEDSELIRGTAEEMLDWLKQEAE